MFKIWLIEIGIWVVSIGASSPMLTIPELRSSHFHDGIPIQVGKTITATMSYDREKDSGKDQV